MKHFYFNLSKKYHLSIADTGKVDSMGKAIVAYKFGEVGKLPLFTGDDLHCSPMHDPESKDSAMALLCFLTLRDGDTDSEYFDKYTAEQLAWSQSFDCEQLSGIVSDWESN